jgi:dephospho-CoA kinase
MDVYGLTGGIGSGKTTVAQLLEEYGVPVVSADELSRIVVSRGSEGLADVVRTFGPEVLDERGDLDRRKMAAIVFQDPAQRRQLEAILHPRIRERFEQVLDALEKAGHEVAVYEVPLLFEKNLQGEMQAVILVTASEAVRTRRVQARDDVTETEVRARMAAQLDETLKRKRADYIVENNGTMDDLRREVEFLLDRFLRVGARRAAAEMAELSSTRMATDEVEQEDIGTPSRMRTEIPSSAGLPVDGEPPMLGQWSQPQSRTVTAPSPPVTVAPSTGTLPPLSARPSGAEGPDEHARSGNGTHAGVAPAQGDGASPHPGPTGPPASPADADVSAESQIPATRRSKTMPAIPVPSIQAQAVGFSTPVAPGLPTRGGTPPAPPPPPALQPTAPQTAPAPVSPLTSTRRTEGVPTQTASAAEGADAALAGAAPTEVPPASPSADDDEDEEPGTARAGNPNAGQETDDGLGNRARRRKTMPASHFVDLRPPGSSKTVPAPPVPPPAGMGTPMPNVPPAPTPADAQNRSREASSDSGASPPPPPSIKRDPSQ